MCRRRPAGDSPFTATSYVHLALACAALLAPGVGEQTLISSLVDQTRADAAEQSITVTDGISDRRQLVNALKLLAAWGVGDRDRRHTHRLGRTPQDAGRALGDLRQAAGDAATALSAAREALAEAGLPAGSLPGEIRTVEHPRSPGRRCCAPTATATPSRSPARPPRSPASSRTTFPPRRPWSRRPGRARPNG